MENVENRSKYIWRCVEGFGFLGLLVVIAILSYYVNIKEECDSDDDFDTLTEKYESVVKNLQYTKETLSIKEFQLQAFSRSL